MWSFRHRLPFLLVMLMICPRNRVLFILKTNILNAGQDAEDTRPSRRWYNKHSTGALSSPACGARVAQWKNARLPRRHQVYFPAVEQTRNTMSRATCEGSRSSTKPRASRSRFEGKCSNTLPIASLWFNDNQIDYMPFYHKRQLATELGSNSTL